MVATATCATIIRYVAGCTYTVLVPEADDSPEARASLTWFEGGVSAAVGIAAERQIACSVAHDQPSGEGFRYMRRSLGLKAKQLGALLGVRAESVSRWENARICVDLHAWVLLGILVFESQGRVYDVRERLLALQEGIEKRRRVLLIFRDESKKPDVCPNCGTPRSCCAGCGIGTPEYDAELAAACAADEARAQQQLLLSFGG